MYLGGWPFSSLVAIELCLRPVSSAIELLSAIVVQLQPNWYLQSDCNYDDCAAFRNLMPIFVVNGTEFATQAR